MNDTCTCGHVLKEYYEPGRMKSYCSVDCCPCCGIPTYKTVPTPKPKLKMQLILLGESSLYVKVEEADARWKPAFDGCSTSFASDNFTLYAGSICELLAPPLHRSALRLGMGEIAKTFVSRATRSTWIKIMEDSLKEWSENWEGFKTCSPSCTNHCPPPQSARVEKKEGRIEGYEDGKDGRRVWSKSLGMDVATIHYTVY